LTFSKYLINLILLQISSYSTNLKKRLATTNTETSHSIMDPEKGSNLLED